MLTSPSCEINAYRCFFEYFFNHLDFQISTPIFSYYWTFNFCKEHNCQTCLFASFDVSRLTRQIDFLFNTFVAHFWEKKKSWERKFLLRNSTEVLAGPRTMKPDLSSNDPTTLSAGFKGRQELWFTILSLGEATLSSEHRERFRFCLFPRKHRWTGLLSWKQRIMVLLLLLLLFFRKLPYSLWLLLNYLYFLWFLPAVKWTKTKIFFLYEDSKVYDNSWFYTAHKTTTATKQPMVKLNEITRF